MAAGLQVVCVVLEDGEAACWGDWFGDTPRRIPGLRDVTAIGVGDYHVCALHRDGTVSCGGTNVDGPLGRAGQGDRLPFAPVDGIADATAIYVGGYNTCIRDQSAGVKCWGRSFATEADPMQRSRCAADQQIQRADTSEYDNVYLTSSGRVLWWGYPEIIDDGRYYTWCTEPATVDIPGRARDVCAGSYHSCAVAEAGTVHCWGVSGVLTQRLGFPWSDGSWPVRDKKVYSLPEPPAVLGVTDAVELSCGDHHTCARLGSGSVQCWGAQYLLGSNIPPNGGNPMLARTVDGVTNAIQIAAGSGRTCALEADGALVCWGDDWLGTGRREGSVVPVAVQR